MSQSSVDYLEITLMGETLWLLSEKAVYWPKHKLCLIADLHIGKLSTFRKAGIGIPQQGEYENWQNLTHILLNYEVETCVFLGDLIHSDYNAECKILEEIIEQFPEIDFILTEGNHDVHSKYQLEKILALTIVEEYRVTPFLMTHIPLELPLQSDNIGWHNIAGHIHPAVQLVGKGRDRMRLPCFYCTDEQTLLPAFGSFTGSKTIKPNKTDSVYVCTGKKVVAM